MPALRVLAGLLVLTLAGCGLVPPPEDSGPGERGGEPAIRSSELVRKSLSDIERFWAAAYPEFGKGDFVAVQGGYFPYTRSEPPPDCGDQPGEYQPNAFYCPVGDFIAWDEQVLIPQLQADYGALLVGVVMAHEYGHAVQARLGLADQPTYVLEQQADCFAGSWIADVQKGNSKAFEKITPAQLDNTVAGMLMLRDQPGTSARAEGAHGNAFDRIRALQEGVEQGPDRCAGYRRDNLPVTEVPFQDVRDAASGGELPSYEDAVNLLAQDAQTYWARTFPRLSGGTAWQQLRIEAFSSGNPPDCQSPDASAQGAAFYCKDGDFIAFDNQDLGPVLYQRIGDNAVGMLLGDLFARAAQARRGASTADKPGQLTVDCLAGSWTNDLLNRDRQNTDIQLSPGDLDEAVMALLAFGRNDQGNAPTAFERIAAYRKGVLSGLGACL
jgi:predicted metalloprotease